MRFCKTTLWIKKSSFDSKEMSVTSFGQFRAIPGGLGTADEGKERLLHAPVLWPAKAMAGG
jgi:hypothetical protein